MSVCVCVCASIMKYGRSSCFSGTYTLVSDCLGASEEIIQSGTDQEDPPPHPLQENTNTPKLLLEKQRETQWPCKQLQSQCRGEGKFVCGCVWWTGCVGKRQTAREHNNDSNLIYAVHEGGFWLEILTLQHFPFHTRNSHLIKLAISSSRDTTGIGIWLNQGWHDHQRPNHLPEARCLFAYYQWVVPY